MEKVFTKEELRELSNATIDKLELKRNRIIFSTIGLLVALVGSVGVARLLGVDQSVIESMTQGIMIANGIVANFGIKLVFRDNRVIKNFRKGVAKLEAGEINEEDYYKKWLEEAWYFAKTNYEEIENELNNGKEHSL